MAIKFQYIYSRVVCLPNLTGPYDIAVAGMEVRGIVTNTPAVDAFRGAGRPEANYLLERLMDHIAHVMGMDELGSPGELNQA